MVEEGQLKAWVMLRMVRDVRLKEIRSPAERDSARECSVGQTESMSSILVPRRRLSYWSSYKMSI